MLTRVLESGRIEELVLQMLRRPGPVDGPENGARVAVVEHEPVRFGQYEEAVEYAVVRDVHDRVVVINAAATAGVDGRRAALSHTLSLIERDWFDDI